MSLPSVTPALVPPHGRDGPAARPPSSAVRAHAIVAVSVISSLGTVSALLAFFVGIFLSDVCHGSGELACDNTYIGVMALSSVPAVGLAVVLAGVGLGRARTGGGHGPAIAAWCVWGGFCLAWWIMVGMAGS